MNGVLPQCEFRECEGIAVGYWLGSRSTMAACEACYRAHLIYAPYWKWVRSPLDQRQVLTPGSQGEVEP
jgi:hypothetical protein